VTEVRTLFKQSTQYLAGQVVIMASGFISFPILTRVFSVEDYGILGLVTTTIFICTTISKFGFQDSIVRFYAEAEANAAGKRFYSSMFAGSVTISALVTLAVVLVCRGLQEFWSQQRTFELISLASLLVFSGGVIVTLSSFLRAEQKVVAYNRVIVVSRYGSLALGIFMVFHLIGGLHGFFIGKICFELGLVAVFSGLLFRRKTIRLGLVSVEYIAAAMKFGFPLVLAGIGYLLLNYIDRYMIEYYLGSVALGLYTAGYNLATHVTDIFMYSLNNAITPIYMRILQEHGEDATKEFFYKAFRYFVMVMSPVAFGFMAIGDDLLRLLASSRYNDGAQVLPYVVLAQLIHAGSVILDAGLLIRKKTQIITFVVLAGCALNVLLNAIFIPRNGIVGAAQVTLLSYVFFVIAITYYSFREFSFRIDWLHVSVYLSLGSAMYFLLRFVDLGTAFLNIVIRVPIGVAFYCSSVLAVDREVRKGVLALFGLRKYPSDDGL
jgi:O-antigen/teichoic acid export membrane protein